MSIAELDAIYREAAWLIAKRSGWAAVKALTIGGESLDRTISEISDLYELSASERRTLRPTIADGVLSTGNNAANTTKSLAGIAATGGDAARVVKTAQSAIKHGRTTKSLVTLATRGPKAAQTFATTGRLAGKANPLILGLTVAWNVGSTGWFLYHARAFNLAAYELRKRQLDMVKPQV